jgi:hypothetical protein
MAVVLLFTNQSVRLLKLIRLKNLKSGKMSKKNNNKAAVKTKQLRFKDVRKNNESNQQHQQQRLV